MHHYTIFYLYVQRMHLKYVIHTVLIFAIREVQEILAELPSKSSTHVLHHDVSESNLRGLREGLLWLHEAGLGGPANEHLALGFNFAVAR